MTIAKIYYDWLNFPRQGTRNLRFDISIISGERSEQLACAESTITCEIPDFGYDDLEQNKERAKTLSIALAFSVSAADGRLYQCEIETIKKIKRKMIWEYLDSKMFLVKNAMT